MVWGFGVNHFTLALVKKIGSAFQRPTQALSNDLFLFIFTPALDKQVFKCYIIPNERHERN